MSKNKYRYLYISAGIVVITLIFASYIRDVREEKRSAINQEVLISQSDWSKGAVGDAVSSGTTSVYASSSNIDVSNGGLILMNP